MKGGASGDRSSKFGVKKAMIHVQRYLLRRLCHWWELWEILMIRTWPIILVKSKAVLIMKKSEYQIRVIWIPIWKYCLNRDEITSKLIIRRKALHQWRGRWLFVWISVSWAVRLNLCLLVAVSCHWYSLVVLPWL